jgi:hypothetical protein
LDNLDTNFIAGDALIRSEPMGLTGDRQNWRRPILENGKPVPVPWPKADVIIGNPPFNGAKKLRPDLGPEYINAVRQAYPYVPGMADYCVLWFRKTHVHLPECTADDPVAGRAGLVGTQNIRNNQSRVGGLDYIAASGTIVEAVDNQPWSGEANVHVSIANWVKHAKREGRLTEREREVVRKQLLIPEKRRLWFKADAMPGKQKIRKRGSGPLTKEYELAFRDGQHINSALSDKTDVSGASVLECNTSPQRIFNGQFPRHQGFVLTPEEAARMIAEDAANRQVVHPYLIGREMITHVTPLRWVIDFQKMDLFDAKHFEAPFRRIEKTVLPHITEYAERERERSGESIGQDQTWLRSWWQHFRCRKEMIDAIGQLSRFLACAEVTKRPIFCFVDPGIRPDHTLEAFAFDDDYSFGILQSNAHWQWFVAKCSKLKSDFRYTPESVFDTFPWPQSPTVAQIDSVAEAGREVRRVRSEALEKIKGGLRAVYRTLELPGKNPLKDAHAALDAAVLGAYAFSAKEDLLAQLLDLNLQVARRFDAGEAVTAPGSPPDYPDPSGLITDDCIRFQ